jgi:hypothetical protein
MRTIVGVGAGLLLAAVGCTHYQHVRDNPTATPVAAAGAPKAADLVTYLNQTSRNVQAIQCTRLAMDCKEGKQGVGVDGMLVCQKDRNFRLKGSVLGSPAVDIGSNKEEFWYWIKEVKPVPYVFHCSYEDLGRGGVQLPFPFQPDMIVAALGMGKYDENGKYRVVMPPNKNYFELIEDAISPQGERVQKVTAFNSRTVDVKRGQPQVIAYALRDMQGKTICQATIQEVQSKDGVVLPRRLTLSWPAQQMEMKMTLSDVTVVNNLAPERATRLFQRSDLGSLPSFDLARRTPDGRPSSLIRASAPTR